MNPRLTTEQQALVLRHRGIVETITRWGALKYQGLLALEDMYQAAQLALIESAMRYRPEEGPFDGFAWRRIKGAIITLARKAVRAQRLEESVLDFFASIERKGSVLTDTPATAKEETIEHTQAAIIAGMLGMLEEVETAEDLLIRREAVIAVRAAIAELPETHRRVIEEVHLCGSHLKEGAAKLGWKTITTRRRRQAALAQLGEQLAHHAPVTLP